MQSLLPMRDTSHKLVSAGADCTVNVWDLSSERLVNTLKASNSVYQLHPSYSPFCTLWEVCYRPRPYCRWLIMFCTNGRSPIESYSSKSEITDVCRRTLCTGSGMRPQGCMEDMSKVCLLSHIVEDAAVMTELSNVLRGADLSYFYCCVWGWMCEVMGFASYYAATYNSEDAISMHSLRHSLTYPHIQVPCLPERRLLQARYLASVSQVAVCSEDYQVCFMDCV